MGKDDSTVIQEVIYSPETPGKDVVFIKPNIPDCFTSQKTYSDMSIEIS